MNKHINPLDWHTIKYMDYIPPHFAKVKFKHNDRREEILQWIENNTSGRFAIASVAVKYDSEVVPYMLQFTENIYIAFEDHSEATMYSLVFS